MIEIERKYAIDDLHAVEEKLTALGFRKGKTVLQIDVPISQVYQTLINSWPRVRHLSGENKTIITVKGKVFSEEFGPVRSETEIETTDFEKSIGLFKALGFYEMGRVEKERTVFVKEKIEVVIDHVIGFGDFVEIEVKTDNEKEGLAKIKELSEKLALKNEIKRGYFDLINEEICSNFRRAVKELETIGITKKPVSNYSVLNENILKIYSEKGAYYAGFPWKKIVQEEDTLRLI